MSRGQSAFGRQRGGDVLGILFAVGLFAAQDAPAAPACASIVNGRDRLACYDALFGSPVPEASRPAEPSPSPQTAVKKHDPAIAPVPSPEPAAPAAAAAERNFGLTPAQQERQKNAATAPIDRIRSRIVAVRNLAWDRFLLDFENGQRWQQVEATPRQQFFVGDEITIRSAVLNSYLATGPNTGGPIRVRRVQ
jgi:hypothetical protein